MQIRSGLAKVTLGDLNRIEFSGITTADAALLAPGQLFKFAGETMLWFTIGTVVSVVPPVIVDLTSDYIGAIPVDVLTTYLITRDFTPVNGLPELSPGDVDIRDVYTKMVRQIDALLGQRIAAQGVTAVTTAATNKTITGTFPTPPYSALVTPNWLTTFRVRTDASKTAGQFVIDFGTAAPASSQVHWAVLG